jgi:steroid 5-alpha reductase family enzyme
VSGIALALSGLGVALAMITLVWIVSLLKRDASIIDIFWGAGFALLAWFYLASTDHHTTRAYLVAALVTLWGLRLSLHILRRNWGKGEDYRYAEMRAHNPNTFPWRSLVTVFWLQAVLLWAIAMPLLRGVTNPSPEQLTWLDIVGTLVFAVGFAFEAVGDWQLARFKRDPANEGEVLDRGLWRYTRHPNYFGDSVVWWGLFLIAAATPGSLWTIYSPIVMTFLLMRVSGVSLLEQHLREAKPAYRDYVRRTSAFFPWFPKSEVSDGGDG